MYLLLKRKLTKCTHRSTHSILQCHMEGQRTWICLSPWLMSYIWRLYPAVMEMNCICAVQYGSHQPPAATALEMGLAGPRNWIFKKYIFNFNYIEIVTCAWWPLTVLTVQFDEVAQRIILHLNPILQLHIYINSLNEIVMACLSLMTWRMVFPII